MFTRGRERRCSQSRAVIRKPTILVACCLAVNSRVFSKLLYRQSRDDGPKNDWQQARNWRNLWVPVPPVHRQVRVKSVVAWIACSR